MYKNFSYSDASGLTSSGRPFWLPSPLFSNLPLHSLSTSWLGIYSFSNFSLQSSFQVCWVVRAIVERLLLHSSDHHRHSRHDRDQQPVCFQTMDDWIAGKKKWNILILVVKFQSKKRSQIQTFNNGVVCTLPYMTRYVNITSCCLHLTTHHIKHKGQTKQWQVSI